MYFHVLLLQYSLEKLTKYMNSNLQYLSYEAHIICDSTNLNERKPEKRMHCNSFR